MWKFKTPDHLQVQIHLRELREYAHALENVAETLFHARGGGPVSWALAAGNIGLVAARYIYPPTFDISALMKDAGYIKKTVAYGPYVSGTIEAHTEVTRALDLDDNRIVFYAFEAVEVIAIRWSYDVPSGVYFKIAETKRIERLIQRMMWQDKQAVQIQKAEPDRTVRHASVPGLHVRPLPPPGAYIGSPTPADVARRLVNYPSNRTILLYGPSGCGKSTLARLVGSQLFGGDARVMKISAHALKSIQGAEIVEIAELAKPHVLILDDFNMQQEAQGLMLDVLETLHDIVPLTILTWMTDNPVAYTAGARPGRIDEYIEIAALTSQQRHDVLKLYMGSEPPVELVEATAGLQGAYLKEIVNRIQVHGIDHWEREVKQLLRHAPPRSVAPQEVDAPPTLD